MIEQWHQTPRWHWRYWFGYRMRRLIRTGEYIGMIERSYKREYRTYRQHARVILEEQANGRSENITAEEIDRRINNSPPHWWHAPLAR